MKQICWNVDKSTIVDMKEILEIKVKIVEKIKRNIRMLK